MRSRNIALRPDMASMMASKALPIPSCTLKINKNGSRRYF